MERKRLLLIILGAIAVISLLICLTIFTIMNSNRRNDDAITKITLCDMDAHNLCVVTFGTDQNNQMLIKFQLPNADYPAFQVKGFNKGTETLYQCMEAKEEPASVYCTGLRTSLGEPITLEVYASENDQLIARGTVMVSALFIFNTPIKAATTPKDNIINPLTVTPTPTDNITTPPTVAPTPTDYITTPLTATPTPDTAYPNP